MRKGFLCGSVLLIVIAFVIISWTSKRQVAQPAPLAHSGFKSDEDSLVVDRYINTVYNNAGLADAGLNKQVFRKAVIGYFNLKDQSKLSGANSVITVVDLAMPSRSKRMYIIDLLKEKLVLNTWVSHGQGSGGDIATQFSNEVDSFQSSIGFYVTDNVYYGKHGKSLRLDGLDTGFNSNAHMRDIVVHAAPYVSTNSINELGRLGRSQGCPAVSPYVIDRVIDSIKGKTLIFINGADNSYHSKYLNQSIAANYAFKADTIRAATNRLYN
jgi:hypothetical protein